MEGIEELAKEHDINIEDCVVFIKEKKILAVDIKYVKIMQRSDEIMGIKFSITPREAKTVTEFFSTCLNGQKLYMNIALTGDRAIYYRGLSPIKKEVTNNETNFSTILIAQKATEDADESYMSTTCAGCEFCHI